MSIKRRLFSGCIALLLLLMAVSLVGCKRDNVKTAVVGNETVTVCTVEQHYSAAPVDDPYTDMKMFYDDSYYYYVLLLGTLKNVPLEKTGNACEYNGNSYRYTLTTTEVSAQSVEKTLGQTASTYIDAALATKFKFGSEKTSPINYEIGLTLTMGASASRTESIKNVVEQSKTAQRSVEIEFNEKNAHGFYRWILMGDLDVYAVVCYDRQSDTYTYDAYSVIAGSSYTLDYSETRSFEKDEDFSLDSFFSKSFSVDESRFVGLVPTERVESVNAPGDGSAHNPFLISNIVQFTSTIFEEDKYYKLTSDLNFEGQNISTKSSFKGHLDGNHHSIYNFVVDGKGLFNENHGEIKNLVVGKKGYTTKISKSQDSGTLFVGAVASVNKGIIENCMLENVTVTSTVTQTAKSRIYAYAGALIGENQGSVRSCTIKGCTIEVKATDGNHNKRYNTYAYAGGLAAKCSGTLENCLVVDSKVSAYAHTEGFWLDDANAYSYAGGLVAQVAKSATGMQMIASNNTVSATGTADGAGDPYCYKGMLFGSREDNSVFQSVYGLGEGKLVGTGLATACAQGSSLEAIPFYNVNFAYSKP